MACRSEIENRDRLRARCRVLDGSWVVIRFWAEIAVVRVVWTVRGDEVPANVLRRNATDDPRRSRDVKRRSFGQTLSCHMSTGSGCRRGRIS